MAKGIKTGGRRPGSKNKTTRAKEIAIAKSGLTPLDYMLGVMRDSKQPDDMRLDAAKSAAPYVHPKLAAIEHTGAGGSPLIPKHQYDDVDIARRIAFVLAKGLHAQGSSPK